MSAHTPGPWHMETVPTSVGVCHKIGPFPGKREGDEPRHACLYADYPSAGNPSDEELAANARLIAAAPELFDALTEAAGTLAACADILNRDGHPRTAQVVQTLHNKCVLLLADALGAKATESTT